jgi:hypothetical protein
LTGTIDEIVAKPARYRWGETGLHLYLEWGGKRAFVHLGPKSFFEEQKVELKVGDKIKVVGSKVEESGFYYYVAREIRKGAERIKIRDTTGVPYFSRGRGVER